MRRFGAVEHMLQVPELDAFDGIVLTTTGDLSASPTPTRSQAGASLHDWFARTVGRSHRKWDDDGSRARSYRGRVTGWRSDACEIRSHPKGVMAHSPGAGNIEEFL